MSAEMTTTGGTVVGALNADLRRLAMAVEQHQADEVDRCVTVIESRLDSPDSANATGAALLLSRCATGLRKAGRLESALRYARRAYSTQPSSIWAIRALGWALRDAIKAARGGKDDSAAVKLVLEFDRLQIPDSESLLLEQRAHYHVGLVGTEQHLADAFRSSREKYRNYPDDPKACTEYFWVLADCVEQAIWLKNHDLAKKFFDSIEQLPRHDEKQEKKLGALKAKMSPAFALTREAMTLSKQGDHAKAAMQYREALRLEPASKPAQEGLGWALARLLQAAIRNQKPGVQSGKREQAGAVQDDVRLQQAHALNPVGILKEYQSLTLVTKPSVLHSWMLALATQAADVLEQHYWLFVQKWGVENLREEDFQPYKPARKSVDAAVETKGEEKTFPSLAEKVGMALGKVAKTIKKDKVLAGVDLKWGAATLAMLSSRFPQHPWLPYYHARLRFLAGEPEEARKLLLPLVRSRIEEFWAWGALADTYPARSRERLSCLCRAEACRNVKDQALLTRIRVNLRDALKAAGDDEAAAAVNRLLPTAQVIGFSGVSAAVLEKIKVAAKGQGGAPVVAVPAPMKHCADTMPAPVKERLDAYAAEAEAMVMSDLPWVAGIVSGIVQPKAGVKGCMFILTKGDDGEREVRVNPHRFASLNGARLGMPVSVRLTIVEGRLSVVGVVPREGEFWDMVPVTHGIVAHLNQDKGLAAIATGVDKVVLAYFDHFPDARSLVAGDALELRCHGALNSGGGRLVWFRRSPEPVPLEFVKTYEGELRKHEKGFGFVGDVFVPSTLADREVGTKVTGVAAMETNRKSGKKGWRALTALPK